MVKITIDYDKCKGEDCLDCVDLCPNEVIKFIDGKVIAVDLDECSYCETCVDMCPNQCITLED